MRGLSPVAILIAVVLLCLVPFLNKAFHIDDPLFLWTAEQIQNHPFDFYGFDVNWYGIDMRMADVQKNPPLVSYYIALVAALFGWGEIALHAAFLLPAIAAALGTFYLAKEFGSRPLLASLVAVLTPAFVVSSTNIMCDTAMLASFVWAIWFWMRGLKTRNQWQLACAAVLIVICTLTKYFGLALVPLLFVYALAREKSLEKWSWFFVIPFVLFGIYQWATFKLYGRGLLMDAVSFASEFRQKSDHSTYARLIIAMAFTGGCHITLLLCAPLLWKPRQLLVGAVALLVVSAPLLAMDRLGLFPLREMGQVHWSLIVQAILFSAGAACLVALALADFWKHRDPDSLLLLLWVLGTIAFSSFINWVINARSLLPLAPVAGILLMRRLESTGSTGLPPWRWQMILPLTLGGLISLTVAWSDYSLANAGRRAATIIQAKYKEQSPAIWFQGHWGFQYYMQKLNALPIDFRRSELEPGDLVVVPLFNTNFRDIRDAVSRRETLQIPVTGWLTPMNRLVGAGFYAHLVGPLPFVFGTVPPEQYSIAKASRALDFSDGLFDDGLAYNAMQQRHFDEAQRYNDLGNLHSARGEWQEAIAKYEIALQFNPRLAPAHLALGRAFLATGKPQKAIAQFEHVLALEPDYIDAMNHLAWVLATHPDPSIRDGNRAVQLAESAHAATEGKLVRVLATLDAAYAEVGRFDEAIATVQLARALAEELQLDDSVRAADERAALYRSRQPYRAP